MSTHAPAVSTAMKGEDEVNSGLHSPPESTNAPKQDATDSELSDLEENEDDIGEIEPDHYDGRVPVFKPTYHQFKNFIVYMNKINHYGMRSGIVKVIPPEEWKAEQPNLNESIKHIRVKDPIKQDIMGTNGLFRQANILHQRTYTIPQWRALCEQSEHQPPAKRGERRAHAEKPTRAAPRTRNSNPLPPLPPGTKRPRGRPKKIKPKFDDEDEDESMLDRLPTPISPEAEDVESVKEEDQDAHAKPRGRQPKATASVSSRRKNNRQDAVGKVDEAHFKNFDYRVDGSQYTRERCEELERAYWKSLTYAQPYYGADMPGTLFDDKTKSWNLGKLDNLLDVLGSKIPGVNTAYLYCGMWKATFAWHLEDVDLYSINYNHFGAPKQWYSIAQGDARRFEDAMKRSFPVDQKACDQFLRHKTFLISPAHLLSNYGIQVNKVVHHPGEFVITFPYGYHSGYNLGYNCAEAVNFALDSWLEFGRVAKKCECDQAQDSVWIDVSEIERKLRGEKTPEYYEVTDDEEEEEEEEEDDTGPTDLPTPPDSSGDAIKTKSNRGRKRKRPIDEKAEKSKVKKIRRIGKIGKQPCCLCPNDFPSEELLPADNGKQAHRRCARYIPETSIQVINGKEKVTGIHLVSKARVDLKCVYCSVRGVGACFQCTRNKCTRACHATCAAAAGVFVEEGETPVFGEDGTEYKMPEIQFNCKFHRTKRDKKISAKDLAKDSGIKNAALQLKKGDICQFQYIGSKDWIAGSLLENRMDEGMLLVEMIPSCEPVEMEYQWLMVPQASDYNIIKPSPNAIPMPAIADFTTSKRQSGDRPRPHDKFCDGEFEWAEFTEGENPKNDAQVKIDLVKENQIWYYLGKKSTEAKAQFTEDIINKPRHNPKGLFLETLPKLPYPLMSAPRQSYPASHPNQNIANVSRPRPQPQHQPISTSRSEKPYNYKPRVPADASFTVDPQALQRREDYISTAMRNLQGGQSSSPAQAWKSPLNNSGFYPPSIRDSPSTPSTSLGAGRTITHSPFGGRAHGSSSSGQGRQSSSNARFSSRPNPFARYAYLQKEHNRSPLEYKSPYMPSGGFMNGYQGSLMKHLQHTPSALSKYTSDTSRQNSSPAAYSSMSYKLNSLPPARTPYNRYPETASSYLANTGSYPTPTTYGPRSNTYTSLSSPSVTPRHTMNPASTQQNYGSYSQQSTPMQSSPLPPPLSVNQSNIGNSWERKDPIMHPAIRRDYIQSQYQPAQSPQVSLPQSNSDNPLYQSYPQQQFQTYKQPEAPMRRYFQSPQQPEASMQQYQAVKQPEAPMRQFQAASQPEAPRQQFQAARQPDVPMQQFQASHQPEMPMQQYHAAPRQPEVPMQQYRAAPRQPDVPMQQYHTSKQPEAPMRQFQAATQPEAPMRQFQAATQPEVSRQQFQAAHQPEVPMQQFQTAHQSGVPMQQFQNAKQPEVATTRAYHSPINPTFSQQDQYQPVSAPAPIPALVQYENAAPKPIYPHQQYFQRPQQSHNFAVSHAELTKHTPQPQAATPPQLPSIQQLAPMLQPQYPTQYSSDESLAKIAECPPDVSNCVSHLMANLRKLAK